MYWVIPEIIHTIPTDGKLEIQVGEGGGGGYRQENSSRVIFDRCIKDRVFLLK